MQAKYGLPSLLEQRDKTGFYIFRYYFEGILDVNLQKLRIF